MSWLTWLAAMALVAVLLGLFLLLKSLPQRRPIENDTPEFFDPQSQRRQAFPSLMRDEASLYISLVVPCYNEEARLGAMMAETMPYLESRARAQPGTFTYEVLLVDDGSRDRTADVARGYMQQYGSDVVRLVELGQNRGKGGAVRQGVHVARGRVILMVDADGATKFEDLARLESALGQVAVDGVGIAVGSRAHLQDAAVAERSFVRNILMHGFHFAVEFLCVSGIRDTQCGFKLFTRHAAQMVFGPLHLERWAFDVEVLYIAQRKRIPVAEVAVNWEEIDGSKLDVVSATVQMARDLLRIRLAYMTGLWRC